MYTPKQLTEWNVRQTLGHMRKQSVPISDIIAALREVLAEYEGKA